MDSKTKILALALWAVTAGVFVFNWTPDVPPSDFRDAVAEENSDSWIHDLLHLKIRGKNQANTVPTPANMNITPGAKTETYLGESYGSSAAARSAMISCSARLNVVPGIKVMESRVLEDSIGRYFFEVKYLADAKIRTKTYTGESYGDYTRADNAMDDSASKLDAQPGVRVLEGRVLEGSDRSYFFELRYLSAGEV